VNQNNKQGGKKKGTGAGLAPAPVPTKKMNFK
jgi:hypothetical protein